jgi:hypothetical protein
LTLVLWIWIFYIVLFNCPLCIIPCFENLCGLFPNWKVAKVTHHIFSEKFCKITQFYILMARHYRSRCQDKLMSRLFYRKCEGKAQAWTLITLIQFFCLNLKNKDRCASSPSDHFSYIYGWFLWGHINLLHDNLNINKQRL